MLAQYRDAAVDHLKVIRHELIGDPLLRSISQRELNILREVHLYCLPSQRIKRVMPASGIDLKQRLASPERSVS